MAPTARRFGWGALVLVASCRLDPDLIAIPTEGSRAVIVAAIGEGGTALHAADLPVPDDLYLPAAGADSALVVLGYGCPLEKLGLAPGPVATGGQRPIPAPRIARRRGADGAWIEAPQPVAELAGITLAGDAPSACLALDVAQFFIPGTEQESSEGAVALDDRRVLVDTGAGRSFVVEDQAATLVQSSTHPPSLALFRDDAGEIWGLRIDGVLVMGTLERGFSEGPRLVSADLVGDAWLDGAGQGLGLELFVLTGGGAFERYAVGSFTRLDGGDLGAVSAGGVARLGPGAAVAVGFGSGDFLHYDRGVLRRSRAPLALEDDFQSAVRLPSGTILAGTRLGSIYRWDGAGWTLFYPRAVSPQARTFGEIGDHVFFGGNGGSMWELAGAGELCPPRSLGAASLRALVGIRDGFFVFSRDRSNGQPISVARVVRAGDDGCGAAP